MDESVAALRAAHLDDYSVTALTYAVAARLAANTGDVTAARPPTWRMRRGCAPS